ncbi:MAG TPA: phytoene desaturase family protein [Candidatus Paceibacterota bacterium]|nr:phytoene desaturase family protein [Verrucomicrobiota bacterium]HSA11116.1 phytoene desaturase family protein [Candidatus Paceibacterota bacterium]
MKNSNMQKHIIIVGAGPGGLTAAMLLAARGFKVTVFEKDPHVGGRNAAIVRNGYKFDTGPTFLMMKFILDEVFEEAGRHIDECLKCVKLEPMYRLQFQDVGLEPTTDREVMLRQLDTHFPGNRAGYDKFMAVEKERFHRMYPCLQKDYASVMQYLSRDMLRALPKLSIGRSLISVLGDYFREDKLRLSFTFQSKYLGMSAWDCPGAFAILPYVEHAFGIYHVMGGLSEISEAMARVCRELGANLRLATPVRQLVLEGRSVRGVQLANGERVLGDETVLNADFGYAMKNLVPPGVLRKYKPDNVDARSYSCSTFMLYLGLDKIYDLPHHTIFFARDYQRNISDIFQAKVLSEDISFYVRNASITDPALAPPGHSSVYVLVPVPNRTAQIDWAKEAADFRDRVVTAVEKRAGMADLRQHIREEVIFTPQTWQDMNIQYGATFNLAHSLGQMLYFRPRNRFEELDNCYLVGGGTHPGSGLPTIYESGRIAANLISRRYGISFVSKNTKV